jgi:hypothetical protein
MPTSSSDWLEKTEGIPSPAVRRMFQDSAATHDSVQSSVKATAVVAQLVLMRLASAAMPEATPALARRMSDDRMLAVILPSVPSLVPRIDSRQTEIGPVFLDVERCHRSHVSNPD